MVAGEAAHVAEGLLVYSSQRRLVLPPAAPARTEWRGRTASCNADT
jgi:hypothetical protein